MSVRPPRHSGSETSGHAPTEREPITAILRFRASGMLRGGLRREGAREEARPRVAVGGHGRSTPARAGRSSRRANSAIALGYPRTTRPSDVSVRASSGRPDVQLLLPRTESGPCSSSPSQKLHSLARTHQSSLVSQVATPSQLISLAHRRAEPRQASGCSISRQQTAVCEGRGFRYIPETACREAHFKRKGQHSAAATRPCRDTERGEARSPFKP